MNLRMKKRQQCQVAIRWWDKKVRNWPKKSLGHGGFEGNNTVHRGERHDALVEFLLLHGRERLRDGTKVVDKHIGGQHTQKLYK